MSDTDFKIPTSLVTALEAGEVVPFTGAGISRAIENKDKDTSKSFTPLFPNWYEFLIKAADKLVKENKSVKADVVKSLLNDSPPDYLEAAQRAFDGLGQKQWYELLSENFEIDIELADIDSLKLAKLVWQLGSNLILTTNIDLVLQTVNEKPHSVKILDTQSPEFADVQKNWKPARPTVFHLHGHIDNKANVVFTKKQYDDFYNKEKNQAKLETLRSLFTQRTVLFIGFSLDDLFILKELERVNLIYEGGASSFYILIHESEKDNANIPSYVEKITFSQFGKPLEDLVEELARIVNSSSNNSDKNPDDGDQKLPENSELDLKEIHFNVPFDSKGDGFVGRVGKFDEIWDALTKNKRAAIRQAVSIEGFGGLGKTQLAVEYAHTFRDKYENGVFWITADEDISVQLIKIGESLNWISQSDKGFDQAELVRNRFRKLTDCLIIFDNVDEQEVIKDYLPEVGFHPHILVTAREEQHGFDPINLDTMSLEEARKLLIQISNRLPNSVEEEKALENILKELDGLPLAVELVGGYLLRRKSNTFQDYLEYLENEPIDRIENKFLSNPFAKRNKSIIRALKISEKLLNETEYLEEILDILAWSGKSSMSYSLLQDLIGTTDKLAIKNALGVALELRFIKREKDETRYSIHRLLAKVRQFEKPLKERKAWHQKIVEYLLYWFRNKEDESKTLSEAELELDHLETWQKQTLEYIPAQAVWLTLLRANPLIERGNYREAQKYTEAAYELFRKENLTDKLLLANLYLSKSLLDSYLGNYKEAKSFAEKALAVYKENSLDDEKLLANLLNNLGGTYSDIGNLQKALELQQQALQMRQKLFGDKHPDIANSLNNLGANYSTLGNPQKALELEQQALEMQRQLFGDKHPDTATSLSNLGRTYSDLGNLQKALELQQQALQMRQELFGDKHPDIANSLNNLGIIYRDLGNPKKALELGIQALKMRQELFGDKHPGIANSLGSLSSSYNDLENPQKALELEKKALEMMKELFGDKHPNIATSLGNLGAAYGALGNPQKALELEQQALEMRQELFGDKHPHIANSLNNLGGTYKSLNNPERALELEKQALEMMQELFGDKHPHIATLLDNLGITYYKLNDKEKSFEFHQSALNMRREVLGDKHPNTLNNCFNFIYVLIKMGRIETAGRLAGEFLSHVPYNHPSRKFFETHGAKYREAQRRKKKHRH